MSNVVDEESTGEGLGRRVVLKLVGGDKTSSVQSSNVVQSADDVTVNTLFQKAGAIDPPYPPQQLASLWEMSNAMRQNVDAYTVNIDGFGHRFEPVIDLEASDVDQRITQALIIERDRLKGDPNQPASVVSPSAPTPDEVKAKKAEIVDLMRSEKTRLEHFFEFCSDEESFVSLRRKMRQDHEVTGNAYMEVLRNGAGEIAQFAYIPGFTMRLLPLDRQATEVDVPVRVSDLSYDTVKKLKRFRRFVQIFEQRTVFFKEFGDRRIVSSKTGNVFPNLAALAAHDASDCPATEVIHFRVHSSRSAYGIPRWIGNLVSVLGSRQAEEVNLLYFENKSIPPMAILVSGGRLTDETVKRLESHIETEIKGKKNFHKVMILEAVGDGGNTLGGGDTSGSMKIEMKPLTESQNKDALFQGYDERNIDKIGMAFRLPRLLRGDIRDFNRASAEAALDFAEQQVFAPEREEFDFIINRKILVDLGAKFWRFQSNATTVKDPAALSTIIKDLVLANIITPEEARELAAQVFNREFVKIDAPWTKQPVPLTLAGIQPVDPTLQPYVGDPDDLGETRQGAWDDRDADGATDPPPGMKLTPTALSQVTTVNEARRSHGLGPKANPDGTPDKDGDLTIAEYAARRAGRTPGVPAAAAAPTAPVQMAAGDLSIADMQTSGGLMGLAQGRRLFRRKPKASAPNDAAKALLAIRDALVHREAKAAAQAFYTAKRAELRAGIAHIPDTVIASLVPVELVSEPGESTSYDDGTDTMRSRAAEDE